MTREIETMVAYMDDSVSVFKVEIPTNNELVAKKFVEGNGEVVAIKKTTRTIDLDNLSDDDKIILGRMIELSGIKA